MKLVEYGIAHLRNEQKGHIVEPLAFLSVMKWLDTQKLFNLQSNIGSRLGCEESRGRAFEEAVNLYLLRQLHYPVSFTTIFDFHDRCTPSWANETARIVARLDGVDVPVDLLGGVPLNSALSVVHYAGTIEEVIDWIDNPDTASVLLVASNLFGPDVLARCQLSPSTNTTVSRRSVLLMGQFKSCTVGNKESLSSTTVADALDSLHRDHWFPGSVCYFASLLS